MEVLEDVQAGAAAQVRIDGHDVRILTCQIGQRVAHLVSHLLRLFPCRDRKLCHTQTIIDLPSLGQLAFRLCAVPTCTIILVITEQEAQTYNTTRSQSE
jgi:hypothetical protein